jgi:membrane fusion protein
LKINQYLTQPLTWLSFMSQLFRQKALEAKRDAVIGRVQVTQPLRAKTVGVVGVLLLGLSLIYAVLGHYTRRVNATGVLLPRDGLLDLSSSVAGIVATNAVKEGQRVENGQLLFVIDREANSVAGPTVRRVIESLRQQKAILQQQRELRKTTARLEKEALQAQILNEQAQHAELAQHIAANEVSLKRLRDKNDQLADAARMHVVSDASFQYFNNAYLELLGRQGGDKQNYLQIEGRLVRAKTDLAAIDDRTLQSVNEIDQNILTIERQIADNEARLSLHVLAPADGVVTALRVHVGQAVESNTTLATLLPNSGLMEANLFVDSSAIGFLRKGAPVLLRYAAFPFQKFGLYKGKVMEMTVAPVTQGTGAPRTASQKDSLYRITVAPELPYVLADGEQHRLEAGMQIQATISLDRRHLYEWMFEPFYQIQKSVHVVTGEDAP